MPSEPRVAVVGSINEDVIVRCERLPAASETVIGTSLERRPGGKGGNQAVAAARALTGARSVAMVGAVADDPAGARQLNALDDPATTSHG